MRDPDTGNSKGFGFVSYDCFEASDAAIEAMNGQYLCNRQITVSYAYKKDTKGESAMCLLKDEGLRSQSQHIAGEGTVCLLCAPCYQQISL